MKKVFLKSLIALLSATTVANANDSGITQEDAEKHLTPDIGIIYPSPVVRHVFSCQIDGKKGENLYFTFNSARSNRMTSRVHVNVAGERSLVNKVDIAQYLLNNTRAVVVSHDNQGNRLVLRASKLMLYRPTSSATTTARIKYPQDLYYRGTLVTVKKDLCYYPLAESANGTKPDIAPPPCYGKEIRNTYNVSCAVKKVQVWLAKDGGGTVPSVDVDDTSVSNDNDEVSVDQE